MAGLAAFLALPVDMVEMVYEIWQDAFDEAGGMELVNVYSKVAYEVGSTGPRGIMQTAVHKSKTTNGVTYVIGLGLRQWAFFNSIPGTSRLSIDF